jgi:hypothetical protein
MWKVDFLTTVKRGVLLLGLLLMLPYAAAYYHSWEFSDFVTQEARFARSTVQLRQSVLSKAQDIELPIDESDINITTTGAVFRVDVAYRIPVNHVFFKSHLNFQAIGTGILRR